MKTVEKMRLEYQLMARSAVSTKMRKMNDYLSDRLKQQESVETDKENITKGIQIDLEERLANSSNELSQVRHRLKSIYRFWLFYKNHTISLFRIGERVDLSEESAGYEGENASIWGIPEEKVRAPDEQVDQQQNLWQVTTKNQFFFTFTIENNDNYLWYNRLVN